MHTNSQGNSSRPIDVLFRSGTSCGLSDTELLDRFIISRDQETDLAQAAFEALVLRHGAMVLDVCRKILGHSPDAEDAFQATFLILATRAASIRRQSSIASWLHGVARRTAARLKSDIARRRAKERKAAESRGEEIEIKEPRREFQFLHEEVDRLPNKYRDPIILCYFEGMSQAMSARWLRCPAGTIGVRLMRAKARLKDRLSRRGESFVPVLLTARVPDTLVRSTIHAAIEFTRAGSISLAVAQLSKEVSRAMLMTKLKSAAAIILMGGMLLSGMGILARLASAEDPAKEAIVVEQKDSTKQRGDLEELQGTWLTRAELHYSLDNVPQPVERIMEKWVIDGEVVRTFPQPTERQPELLNELTHLITDSSLAN